MSSVEWDLNPNPDVPPKLRANESAATLRPEAARLREVIEQAVEQFCALAEERQAAGDQETAVRIWAITNEYLEVQVTHGR